MQFTHFILKQTVFISSIFLKPFSSRSFDVSKYLVRKMLPVMEEVIFQMIYFTIVLMRSYLILLEKNCKILMYLITILNKDMLDTVRSILFVNISL